MLTILLAILSMAARDAVSTFLTVAEARGRPLMAATLDALGDLAGWAVIIFGAGAVIQAGALTVHAAIVLGVMVLTSFLGTLVWTKLANRIQAANAPSQVDQLEARLERLEARERSMTRLIGVLRDRHR